jgi:deoxyribodipyrimidine photo-lyase
MHRCGPLTGHLRKPHMKTPIILWFRQDLRLDDLPALHAAAAAGRPVIPCYILDDESPGNWRAGAASRWWLHHSLHSLAAEIKQSGGSLVVRRGNALAELQRLVRESGAETIVCSRQYEPWAVHLEESLHQDLSSIGADLKRYPGSLLFEPGQILNGSGLPFRVFTPFWKRCLREPPPPMPRPRPNSLQWWADDIEGAALRGDVLDELDLLPHNPDWAAHWPGHWQPGTQGALANLRQFLSAGIAQYSEGRDHPDRQATSRLSAHLHFGEISPRLLWQEARQLAEMKPALTGQVAKFLSELGWREFSAQLLFHFPHITDQPFKDSFQHFPWLGNKEHLGQWQRGQTGYPMVDAGMRELWHTGFMHNRVRMIAASFLTKHLLLPWQTGARWFWDTLVDADLANNTAGWQWVAGSGADASPYFRIFNPIIQGEKFDGEGVYIRQWVPELKNLPGKYLNRPWEAPEQLLKSAGVELGVDYPTPIVDHKSARESALAAYQSIRGS